MNNLYAKAKVKPLCIQAAYAVTVTWISSAAFHTARN